MSAAEGRRAVVTGGGRGIGAAVARALAASGCRVMVTARSEGEVEAVAVGLREQGHVAAHATCDVTSEADVVRPRGPDFEVIVRVGLAQWRALASVPAGR